MAKDRQVLLENPRVIEPFFLERYGPEVGDLLAQLPAAAQALKARLHPGTAASLADLVRVMNCYFSNLIEGHNTRPRDIERALKNDLEKDRERRNLQLEALAHIRVQREIDRLHAGGKLPEPTSPDFIRWIHREFYRDAPEEALTITSESGSIRVKMEPGEWRTPTDPELIVGRHSPPSGASVPGFMRYFADKFRLDSLSPSQKIVAIASAHHRFNYIHPFLDGNGRVSRLMSHAMCLTIDIGAHGLWSVSRGLARGLNSRQEYKQMMNAADAPREGDYDGRGNLSMRRLEEFVAWFLGVCLDQVRYMTTQFQLETLEQRVAELVRKLGRREESIPLLNEVLLRGQIARGEAAAITGLSERLARDILKSLEGIGILASDSPKGPVSLRFTVESAEALFPVLFPQT